MKLLWRWISLGIFAFALSTAVYAGNETSTSGAQNKMCEEIFDKLSVYNISKNCTLSECQQKGGIANCINKTAKSLEPFGCDGFKVSIGLICDEKCGGKIKEGQCPYYQCQELCCAFNRTQVWRPCGNCDAIPVGVCGKKQ
ncbi:MAG: hypothetical protein BGO67_07885 [Alphaproteobacteria bacterium 41-28]|nr:MAG: hypothetical protein BGO67_07885 [Alphaproteobacteria bacterium 41-28]